ncbi:ribonucleotide-diphosphate reductase subunit alpha [candidate division TA06 bacterium DG_26]|uniref:Vitamin B12-dependent ribonucleotide reductase n=1 Tax=candidate division TA06 bacterium DG_26 TaxID=1703771 RepID=A0A0S7WFI2_UNCT6|nr:MAG: ribonucleotide-diphosphate reductase subunit alpha [candidate division TA06 bacterium DG_26]
MSLSPNALAVLRRRYLKKSNKGEVIENPYQMFKRVAKNIASADLTFGSEKDAQTSEKQFLDMMTSVEFLPNSPTLMNAGRDLQQLSACFVLPIEDSMESIFEAVKNTALIHKSGGGTGFSFSRIRPKNDVVRSTRGVSSGPISFMTVFDAATEAIKQGGTRRGANMAILRVDHPDILEFITCKQDSDVLNNFNISVALTDGFMKALERKEKFDVLNPRTKEVLGRLDASDVFQLIAENAWRNGDPGVIFIDRINQFNPTPQIGEIESTNPCGEQPLLPYESCNLGSINLIRMMKGDEIDWQKLGETAHKAVHFLDNVIEMNNYPIPQIKELTLANRKIGLGVMGFADVLARMWVPYDSREAVRIAEKIMGFVEEEARAASVELGKKRGSFPSFEKSIWKGKYEAIRNAATTTIAPTGTISMIADCSSGIEPFFALCYVKAVMEGSRLLYVNGTFEKVMKERGLYSEELFDEVAEKGSIKDMEKVPKDIREAFVTALDIAPEWHVRMQAAFQKHTDNAVSKTINFPNNATVDDVKDAYLLAHKLGCKGITVYRDGSRDVQVLNIGQKETQTKRKGPRPRPILTVGLTEKIKTGDGTLYLTINEDDTGLCEVFTNIGKAGGNAAAQSEAISRLISLALRSGVDVKSIVRQLKGISGPSPVWDNGDLILSAPDAIAKALERYLKRKDVPDLFREKLVEGLRDSVGKKATDQKMKRIMENRANICAECGSIMVFEEGCMKCYNCGFSRCY